MRFDINWGDYAHSKGMGDAATIADVRASTLALDARIADYANTVFSVVQAGAPNASLTKQPGFDDGTSLTPDTYVIQIGGYQGSVTGWNVGSGVDPTTWGRQLLSNAGVSSSQPSGSTYTGSAPSPGATQTQQAPSFRFENLTSGNTSMVTSGDTWKITITGPPGAEIHYVGGKGGQSGTVSMGTIPGDGIWTLVGTVSDGDIGNWVESWYVGGNSLSSISFVVQAKPQAAPTYTQAAQTQPPAQTQPQPTYDTTQPYPVSYQPYPVGYAQPSVMPTTEPGTILGMSQTTFLLLAAAAVGAFLLFSGGKKS